MEFKRFSAGKCSYGTNTDNKSKMRFNLEEGEAEITNVNFDDKTFYSHLKNK